MTTADQMQALTTRIVAEALDIVRAEAEQRAEADEARREKNLKHGMPAGHVSQWADGVCYCKACGDRRRQVAAYSPEMPCWPLYDAQTRPIR
jgi:hypothetical protein